MDHGGQGPPTPDPTGGPGAGSLALASARLAERLRNALGINYLRAGAAGVFLALFLGLGRVLGHPEWRGGDMVLGPYFLAAVALALASRRWPRVAARSGLALPLVDVPAAAAVEFLLLAGAPNPAELVGFNTATFVVLITGSALLLDPRLIVLTAAIAAGMHGLVQVRAGVDPANVASTAALFGMTAALCAYGAARLARLVEGIARNLAGLHKAERALARAVDLESRVVADAHIGVAALDQELRCQVWNHYMEETTGVCAEAILGKHLCEVFPAQSQQEWAEESDLRRSLAGEVVAAPDRRIQLGGRTAWVSATLGPMRSTRGEVIGAMALVRDITAHKQAEEELRTSQASFRDLIDQSPDGILLHREGRLLYVNRQLMSSLGYEAPAQLAGRPLSDIIHPEDRALAADRIEHALDGNGPTAAREIRFLHREGRAVFTEIRGANVSFEGAKAVVVVVRDLTERKALQEQLMLSDRMASMGTLAAGIAHEINNPMASIISNLDFLAHALAGLEGESAGALSDAREASRRVRDIVKDLKVFSYSGEERRGPVALEKVLDFALRMARGELKHRARVVRDYNSTPTVLANEARLGQVFLNLLVNAAQAIPEGRSETNEVRVSARTDTRGWAVVEVRDSGSGMTAEVKQRIFDPFFTTKPVGVGTGLGLAICQKLIAAHGGSIEVESEPGKGTVFLVYLPAAEAAASRPLAPSPQGALVPDLRIEGSFAAQNPRQLLVAPQARRAS